MRINDLTSGFVLILDRDPTSAETRERIAACGCGDPILSNEDGEHCAVFPDGQETIASAKAKLEAAGIGVLASGSRAGETFELSIEVPTDSESWRSYVARARGEVQ